MGGDIALGSGATDVGDEAQGGCSLWDDVFQWRPINEVPGSL